MNVRKEEVEQFLRRLKQKMKVFDIVYLEDRPKNAQTLIDLEITPAERDEYIANLAVKDYSEGPFDESFYGGQEMWVFGKEISQNEVYIKITLGMPDSSAVCISFHIAEYKMNYPFK